MVGKTKEELQKMTGLSSITFCHATVFLLATDRLEDAIKVCEMTVTVQPGAELYS